MGGAVTQRDIPGAAECAREMGQSGWMYPTKLEVREACQMVLPPECRKSGPIETERGWIPSGALRGTMIDVWYTSPVPGVSIYHLVYFALQIASVRKIPLSEGLRRVVTVASWHDSVDGMWTMLTGEKAG